MCIFNAKPQMNNIRSVCDNEGWCKPEPECYDALFAFDPKLSLLTQNKISNLFQLSASSDTGWVNYLCRLLEELEWDTRHPGGLEDQLHIKKQSSLLYRAWEHRPCCQLVELPLTLSEASRSHQSERRTTRVDFDLARLYKETQSHTVGTGEIFFRTVEITSKIFLMCCGSCVPGVFAPHLASPQHHMFIMAGWA